jgi:hypothetical protein
MDPVVELLAKQSASRLREMGAQIETQIEDLRVQGAWIQRAIEHKLGTGTSSTPAADEDTPTRTAKRTRSSKRDQIKKIMQTDPARTWLPSEVRDILTTQGVESTAAAVRVALRRMGDDNEVVRPDDGNGWILASANGNGAQPAPAAAEQPSSGLGGSDQ